MAKKPKPMSDEDLKVALDASIRDGIGHFDTILSREREKILDYYHGLLPRPVHAGSSKYVSMDVWDTVESAKAVLLETFAAGNKILSFTPESPQDVELSKIATDYTSYVIFRQNNGYNVFQEIIMDGLLARVGVAKVYWDKQYYNQEEEAENVDPDALEAALGDDEDLSLKEEPDINEDGSVNATIVRRIDRSQVRIEAIPPEEFIIATTAKALDKDLPFCAHRMQKTVADVIAMGLPREKALELSTDSNGISTEPEKIARFGNIADTFGAEKELQEDQRKVTVYECYAKLDIEGTGEPCLWKVTKVGDHILDKERVERHPFIPFVPLPLPHAFYGSNYADKVVPIQNARTVLMRGILDHTVITNNPRTVVVKGALVNPKEMLENRIGGVVNVTRPDGIFPFPQTALNPFVFQTIQLLDDDKEDTTGVSKLSQGLNKDAVSNQNSEGLVENLVTLSQQRQKIIARNFAYNFLVPLYLEVYRLVIENEDRNKVVELTGNWVEIDPSTWADRKDITVSLHLGYGEQEKEANKFLALHQFLSSDPGMQGMYDTKQKYNMVSKYLEARDINVQDVLIPPEQVQPPPPPPDYVASVKKLEAEAEAITAKMKLAEVETQFKQQLETMKLEFAKMQEMMQLMINQRDMERKEFEAKSRDAVAQRELDILEREPPTETKQTQIVSPG